MTSPYAPPSPDLDRPPTARGRGKPVPVLAMLLSFCAVGLGHVYAGRPKRAVVWVVLPLGFYAYFGLVARFARGGRVPGERGAAVRRAPRRVGRRGD